MRVARYMRAAVFALCVSSVPAVAQTDAPRPVDEVMSLSASRTDDGSISLSFKVAPGVYLYKDKIAAISGGQPVPVQTPPGKSKDDPTFGAVEIYDHDVAAKVDPRAADAAKPLDVTYQGCAERGVCYPPVTRRIDLAQLDHAGAVVAARPVDEDAGDGDLEAHVADDVAAASVEPSGSATARDTKVPPPDQGAALAPTLTGSLPLVLATFFGLGLLLAFTPCVYPMLPILVGVLARAGETLSARRGFVLSGAYAFAMALAYGALGVAAAWSGQNLQTALQTPIALTVAAFVFVGLALSMFGVFHLQAPGAIASRFSGIMARARGSVLGAAALGFVSALVVGPCVTPPLAAALVYVAQTGDIARGSAALFAMGLGMGAPLVAVGLFGAKILPKSGPWLEGVKKGFGVVFLAIAIVLMGRIAPPTATLGLWAAFSIALGVFLGAFDGVGRRTSPFRRLSKAAGVGAVAYGVALVVGVASGADDPARPLARLAAAPASAPNEGPAAKTVASAAELASALETARAEGRPSVVTFTADWCVTCSENERTIASSAPLKNSLNQFVDIEIDVTRNDSQSRKIMKSLGVVGPPTMLIYDRRGEELRQQRSTGAVDVDALMRALEKARTS